MDFLVLRSYSLIILTFLLNTNKAADTLCPEKAKEFIEYFGFLYTRPPDYERVKRYLDEGANPNGGWYYSGPILLKLISHQPPNRQLIDLFLEHPKIEVNTGDHCNYTPLMAATSHPDILKKLLSIPNIDISIGSFSISGDETTALDYAVMRYKIESIKLLLKNGARATEINSYGRSPLEKARKKAERKPADHIIHSIISLLEDAALDEKEKTKAN